MLWTGLMCLVMAILSWIGGFVNLIIYAAAFELHKQNFPYLSLHRAARLWLLAATVLQGISVFYLGQFWKERYPLWSVYVVLITASLLSLFLWNKVSRLLIILMWQQ